MGRYLSSKAPIQAISIAPAAKDWLAETQQATILHSFKPVVNMVNQEGNVLSLVNSDIGNGPFSVVVAKQDFPLDVRAEDQIKVFDDHFWLGEEIIHTAEALVWDARPDWEVLRAKPKNLRWAANLLTPLLKREAQVDSLAHLVLDNNAAIPLPARILQTAQQAVPDLFASLAAADANATASAAKRLAGLGPGLTPAGDDLLLGAMHGLWATATDDQASEITGAIGSAAIPRTHALSGAWLNAGARGEAAERWHLLFQAINQLDDVQTRAMAMRILPTGHTSGADALGGFVAVLNLQ
jgi:hypothetical protein